MQKTNVTVGQSVDEALFNELLYQLRLGRMWEFVQETNPSANLPYHNTKHMLGVAIIAWKIYCAMPNYSNPGAEGDADLKALIIACLWHDYDHSGGEFADSVNIDRAIAGLEKWRVIHQGTYHGDKIIEKAKQIIQVTEFPFIHTPDFHVERVIRDADILYTFSDNTGEIVFGLFTELSQAGKFKEGFTFEDFLKGQREFLTNVEFFTMPAQVIFETNLDRVLALQNQYTVN